MIKTCEHCKREFKADKKARKFCSRGCNGLAQIKPKIECNCLVCGKKFWKFPSDVSTYNRGKFCSFDCRGKYWSGERHVNWNGGVTIRKDQARKSPKYAAWRLEVYGRDGGKCVMCGSDEKIVADHIKPRYLFPELIYEVSNGRTLCRGCHESLPTSRINDYKPELTRADFEEGGRLYN